MSVENVEIVFMAAEKSNNFSYELNGVLSYMTDVLGVEYPTDVYGTEYLIVSILDAKKCHGNMLLDNCLMSNNMTELRNIYISHITENIKPNAMRADRVKNERVFSDTLNKILDLAEKEAERFDSKTIGSEHVLLAMLNPNNGFKVSAVFQSMGVNYKMILHKCEVEKPKTNHKQPTANNNGLINANGGMKITGNLNVLPQLGNQEYISRFTINVSKLVSEGKLDELIGREAEIGQIMKIFSRRRKNNVILVGEPGVGKTTIVYGLAERINSGNAPQFLLGKEIVMLDIMALVSGTNFRGMLEERVDNLFKELSKSKKYILFLDDIQGMLKSGTKEKDTDLSGVICGILNDGDVRVIATTNNKDYRNTVEFNTPVSRKLQKVTVEPNTKEDAVRILNGIKYRYESFHNVYFGSEVVEKIVTLSDRYISNSCLPDSAIDIMDSTGAYASFKTCKSEELASLKNRLNEIEGEKEEILNNGEFEKMAAITLEENDINTRIGEIYKESGRSVVEVTTDDVSNVISEITNVPISKLNSNDKKNIAKIDEVLKGSVIGQDEAINEICKSIKRNRVGLGYKSATKGVFFFGGESGVGKSLLAKKLAEEIYGNERSLIRLDMSEYQEKNSVSKLYGSAPGYVGYESGGQLTEAVKNKPYSVILLDEIEKADPEVYNVFLQLFDEGRMTDSSGQLVNFKNCIVIMTSNIGVKQAAEMGSGIGFNPNANDNSRNIIEKQLKNRFPPEFLNRIDKIVYFNKLTDENLKEIISLEISKLNKRLNEMKYSFEFDSSVVDYIHSLAKEQKEYGARPIVRLIQENIEDGITDLLLNDEYQPEYVFHGTCIDNKIVIK